MTLRASQCVLLFLCLLSVSLATAQGNELTLKKSNDLIYEGNNLVEEDFVEAEKEYRKAISKLPSNAVGSYNLGNAYYNSGHLDEALLRHLETTQNAGSKKEKHAAFHNIGNILMDKELCKEAVEAYKNALRNDPTDDESRYNLALAKECAKNQGGGDGEDEQDENKNPDESENENEDQKEEGEDQEEQDSEGDDKQEQNEGDDKEDDNGKPSDEKDNKQENNPNEQRKKQQQAQPGKLSPQQVKNLLEAMNNQEKKVQEKINAQKTKGVKVRTEKDW
ncbi:MAG: tetratricopeptide repeat protein [Bacteroidia bacterium]|nr:tetratricopeptide repeat protein [Bacteroidia bacterium]NND52525.1 tetratricopeptide repeat protein [Flavobacteriaceae bacterium]